MKKKQDPRKLALKKKTITALRTPAAAALAGGMLPASKYLSCYCDSAGCNFSRTCC